jgi:hypothetical protein
LKEVSSAVENDRQWYTRYCPLNDICLFVLEVKLWCKRRKVLEFLIAMRYLFLIQLLNFIGSNELWLWRMLVVDENRNSNLNVIDWEASKTKRDRCYLRDYYEEDDFDYSQESYIQGVRRRIVDTLMDLKYNAARNYVRRLEWDFHEEKLVAHVIKTIQ